MSSNIVSEWFGLKRPNFILDPKSDSEFYAKRTGVDIPSIVEGLEINLVTDRPPKRFFWGLYGGGKTHTLNNISRQLEKLVKVHTVYVECPSVPKKSTFLQLYHDGIMASMGQDFVVKIFTDLIADIGVVKYDVQLQKLKEVIGDEEISRATSSLLGARTERELAFWRFISGVSVPSRDLTDLGQTQDLADVDPSKLTEVILIIGRLLKKLRGETLVLIIDELDRLKSVTDEFGISTYENAFRKLIDENQRNVSLIIGASAANIRDFPGFIGNENGPIISRIGVHNLIEIPEISANDVDLFIKKIISYVVDPEGIQDKVNQYKKDTKEKLTVDYYPFTNEAIEALKGSLRNIMTPREITQRLSDAAGKAFLQKKHVVVSEIIGG